jgi:hypothetical protein
VPVRVEGVNLLEYLRVEFSAILRVIVGGRFAHGMGAAAAAHFASASLEGARGARRLVAEHHR